MRKLMYLTLAVCLMMAGAVAANAAEPAAAKIGVVDMQAVATQSEPAQAAKKQMESKYGKERAALEKQGEALKKSAEELKGPKASDEKKLAFIRKKQELDQKTRNFLRKVEQDEVKLRQDMVTMVFNATYNVAQKKGFNFVVDITAGGVLYADQTMDLTQDVLAEVNRLHKEDKAKEDWDPNTKKEPPGLFFAACRQQAALSCARHRAKLRHHTHQRSFPCRTLRLSPWTSSASSPSCPTAILSCWWTACWNACLAPISRPTRT